MKKHWTSKFTEKAPGISCGFGSGGRRRLLEANREWANGIKRKERNDRKVIGDVDVRLPDVRVPYRFDLVPIWQENGKRMKSGDRERIAPDSPANKFLARCIEKIVSDLELSRQKFAGKKKKFRFDLPQRMSMYLTEIIVQKLVKHCEEYGWKVGVYRENIEPCPAGFDRWFSLTLS